MTDEGLVWCWVQINFVVVGLNRKSLGLHRMYVKHRTKDNIKVHEILVEGFGWEVYVARCLHTI